MTAAPTPLDLEPIKARIKAAMPGAWEARHESHNLYAYVVAPGANVVARDVHNRANANLIAAAPSDLSSSVQEIERLRAENVELQSRLATIEAETVEGCAKVADEAVKRLRPRIADSLSERGHLRSASTCGENIARALRSLTKKESQHG